MRFNFDSLIEGCLRKAYNTKSYEDGLLRNIDAKLAGVGIRRVSGV